MTVLSLGIPNLSYDIALSAPTLHQLRTRHPELDGWWRGEFGYGIDTLTEGEAGHLRAAPSVDTIRNRIVEARRDLHVIQNESPDTGSSASTTMVDQEEARGVGPADRRGVMILIGLPTALMDMCTYFVLRVLRRGLVRTLNRPRLSNSATIEQRHTCGLLRLVALNVTMSPTSYTGAPLNPRTISDRMSNPASLTDRTLSFLGVPGE